MLFTVLWARIYEVGNFKIPFKNRWVFYGLVVGIPSIFHALYVSYRMNDFIFEMDK